MAALNVIGEANELRRRLGKGGQVEEVTVREILDRTGDVLAEMAHAALAPATRESPDKGCNTE